MAIADPFFSDFPVDIFQIKFQNQCDSILVCHGCWGVDMAHTMVFVILPSHHLNASRPFEGVKLSARTIVYCACIAYVCAFVLSVWLGVAVRRSRFPNNRRFYGRVTMPNTQPLDSELPSAGIWMCSTAIAMRLQVVNQFTSSGCTHQQCLIAIAHMDYGLERGGNVEKSVHSRNIEQRTTKSTRDPHKYDTCAFIIVATNPFTTSFPYQLMCWCICLCALSACTYAYICLRNDDDWIEWSRRVCVPRGRRFRHSSSYRQIRQRRNGSLRTNETKTAIKSVMKIPHFPHFSPFMLTQVDSVWWSHLLLISVPKKKKKRHLSMTYSRDLLLQTICEFRLFIYSVLCS